MIVYQVESIKNCISDIKPLLVDHYNEIALHKDEIKLNPDYDKYIEIEKAGSLRVCTARKGGELIGYFITFVHTSLHYKDDVYGVNDIVFLKKEYRGSIAAYKLFKYAINDLKSIGVKVVCIHMKVKHEFRDLLLKLGFSLSEENWERVL